MPFFRNIDRVFRVLNSIHNENRSWLHLLRIGVCLESSIVIQMKSCCLKLGEKCLIVDDFRVGKSEK